jgi:hypothetical protein
MNVTIEWSSVFISCIKSAACTRSNGTIPYYDMYVFLDPTHDLSCTATLPIPTHDLSDTQHKGHRDLTRISREKSFCTPVVQNNLSTEIIEIQTACTCVQILFIGSLLRGHYGQHDLAILDLLFSMSPMLRLLGLFADECCVDSSLL